jgi:hypothetical protein
MSKICKIGVDTCEKAPNARRPSVVLSRRRSVALLPSMTSLPLSEESLTALREDVARRMEGTKAFEVSIAEEFAKLFSRAGDISAHGQTLWYLMQKEQDGTVNAKKCGVYLQYYYLTMLSHTRARAFRRHLTTIDLCFLTAVASGGMDFYCEFLFQSHFDDRQGGWIKFSESFFSAAKTGRQYRGLQVFLLAQEPRR